MANYLVFCI